LWRRVVYSSRQCIKQGADFIFSIRVDPLGNLLEDSGRGRTVSSSQSREQASSREAAHAGIDFRTEAMFMFRPFLLENGGMF
jgi:hypothetical protein